MSGFVAVEVAEPVQAPGEVGEALRARIVASNSAVGLKLLDEGLARAIEVLAFAHSVAEIVERARHVAPGGDISLIARQQPPPDVQLLAVCSDGRGEFPEAPLDVTDLAEQR